MAVFVESLQQRLWFAKLRINIDYLALHRKSSPAPRLEDPKKTSVESEESYVRWAGRASISHGASWAVARTLALTLHQVRKH